MIVDLDRVIPDAPSGKSGWPWELVQSSPISQLLVNHELPIISLITPSFNQGEYIEETIRSIVLQGYPRLEYIIVDGGSTDNTLSIIDKYSHLIDIIISEPDNGQSDAINKGWKLSTGQISTWINSDDYLAPGVLFEVAKLYINSPSIIVGDVVNFYGNRNKGQRIFQSNISINNILKFWTSNSTWHQPGIFFPLETLKEVGYLNTKYHFAMDFDLLCKILPLTTISYSDIVFTYFRLHENSKGVGFPLKTILEKIQIYYKFNSLNTSLSLIDKINFGIWYLKFSMKLLIKLNFVDLIKFNRALIIK